MLEVYTCETADSEVFPYELAFPLISRGGLFATLSLGLAQYGKTQYFS